MRHQTFSQPRKAYTLVEILVALGIILAVMGLVVAFYPNYSQREQHNRSADIIKNALMRSRQWAIRDKASTGITFASPAAGETETKIQFFQNPPILYGIVGNITYASTASGITLTPPALAGKIFANDYFLEEASSGQIIPHRVTANGDATSGAVSLSSAISTPTSSSYKFRFVRGARLMDSEPVVTLAQNVTVKVFDPNSVEITTAPQIMFSPRGQIEPWGTGKYTIVVILNEADGSSEVDRISLSIDAINGITRGK